MFTRYFYLKQTLFLKIEGKLRKNYELMKYLKDCLIWQVVIKNAMVGFVYFFIEFNMS